MAQTLERCAVERAPTPSPTTARAARSPRSASGFLQTYHWNDRGQLDSVSTTISGNTTVVRYTYDGLGRRITRDGPGGFEEYLYDGDHVIVVMDDNQTVLRTFSYYRGGDKPLLLTGIRERRVDCVVSWAAPADWFSGMDIGGWTQRELVEDGLRNRAVPGETGGQFINFPEFGNRR